MPIPATRLLALLSETEAARDALRSLTDIIHDLRIAVAAGAYTPEQALSAIAEHTALSRPPTFEIAAVERAHWNRHGAANAAKAAAQRQRRYAQALAQGRDPDAFATQTAPTFIGHIRGAVPASLRGASLPQPAKPQAHRGDGGNPGAEPAFPIFPDVPPPRFVPWEGEGGEAPQGEGEEREAPWKGEEVLQK